MASRPKVLNTGPHASVAGQSRGGADGRARVEMSLRPRLLWVAGEEGVPAVHRQGAGSHITRQSLRSGFLFTRPGCGGARPHVVAFPPRKRLAEVLGRIRKYEVPEVAVAVESPMKGIDGLGALLNMLVRDPIVIAECVQHSLLIWRPPGRTVTPKRTILCAFALSGVALQCKAYRRRRTPDALWSHADQGGGAIHDRGLEEFIKGLQGHCCCQLLTNGGEISAFLARAARLDGMVRHQN